MVNIAQNIMRNTHDFDDSVEMAMKNSISTSTVGNGWVTIYTFEDGSKIKKEMRSAADTESSRIGVYNEN